MSRRPASGLEISFFIFAVLLLVVPVTRWVTENRHWSAEIQAVAAKAMPLLLGAMILISFPGLRRLCKEEFARPIPVNRRAELGLVVLLDVFVSMAAVGAAVLLFWGLHDSNVLGQQMRPAMAHEAALKAALTPAEAARFLVVGGILAPVVEELVFRGFLYKAWARQLGWVPSMFVTSVMFAAYHPLFISAFIISVLYVVLLRRTGTLWAPIAAHAAHNIILWYPLGGQFVLPGNRSASEQLASWTPHIACFAALCLWLPIYAWTTRGQQHSSNLTAPDGTLPR